MHLKMRWLSCDQTPTKRTNRIDTVHVAGDLASSAAVQGMIAVAPVSSINTPVSTETQKEYLAHHCWIIGSLVILAGFYDCCYCYNSK
jgi:hypothetical protein